MKASVEVQHVGQTAEEIEATLKACLDQKVSRMQEQVTIIQISEPYEFINKFGGFSSTKQDIVYEVR